MAKLRSVWGIDLGQCALKALKLTTFEGETQVEAFDVIEHPRVLSQPDVDAEQIVRNALEQFLARNSVLGSTLVIAVPGQSSFTRFVKLPPVEPRKVPEIVRYEAEQQIPFDIDEVIWRWQTFRDPDAPDVELGLFAMKKEDIASALSHFGAVDMRVDVVQMAPLALYNFMVFDEQCAPEGATLLVDVGADQTYLVVADGAKSWNRSIQIGGNNFTEALVRTFKLSFAKAEKLKRTAATSKYARQIFQAMRPVFADLVQEVQRSVGYYTSLHREARFARIIGLGNGFRLPGLQKYLEQNLNIPVTRVDSYNRLRPSPAINAPMFTENVLSFAVAYGLAIQGLGEATVSTNLLPAEIVRHRQWSKKRPWFAAAAAAIVLAVAVLPFRADADRRALEDTPQFRQARQVARRLEDRTKKFRRLQNDGVTERELIDKHLERFEPRAYWPSVLHMISQTLREVAPRRPDGLTKAGNKNVVYVEQLEPEYREDLEAEEADERGGPPVGWGEARRPEPTVPRRTDQGPKQRGFVVRVTLRTPLEGAQADQLMSRIANESLTVARGLEAIKIVGHPPHEPVEMTGRVPRRSTGGPPPYMEGYEAYPEVPDKEPAGEQAGPVGSRWRITWKVATLAKGEPPARRATARPYYGGHYTQ
jgi:type IV pilus assembly protein PilM